MSPKELMYIEDALGHEQILLTQCRSAAQSLQDGELRQYANQLAEKHQKLYDQLYRLV